MSFKFMPNVMRTLVKDAALLTGAYDDPIFGLYPYLFKPNQLIFLTECISRVADVQGCLVEAGCYRGATTVFLKKFMEGGPLDRDYYAIDTFSGYLPEHVQHEIDSRGKPARIRAHWAVNKKAWFDKSMALHKIRRLTSIESDVTKFDFRSVSPIAFCLLDVDLYSSTKKVLPKIYAAMATGGIIILGQCRSNTPWDGGLQAYVEFMSERQMPCEIVAEKLGVVRVCPVSAPWTDIGPNIKE